MPLRLVFVVAEARPKRRLFPNRTAPMLREQMQHDLRVPDRTSRYKCQLSSKFSR